MRILFFLWFLGCTLSAVAESTSPFAPAKEKVFFIDSGVRDGLYFQIAGLLAAINAPSEAGFPCAQETCTVQDTLVVNRSSKGSRENLQHLCQGNTSSILAQSNLAYMAYKASGFFEGEQPCTQLRALASLYPEVLQLVVKAEGDIQRLADLPNRKIAVDSLHSDSFYSVQELLLASDIAVGSIKFVPMEVKEASLALQEGRIDALVFFAGIPAPVLQDMAQDTPLRFLSFEPQAMDAFLKKNAYYHIAQIPEGVYGKNNAFQSIALRALWLVHEDIPEDLAYDLVANLWKKSHPLWIEESLRQTGWDVKNSLEGIGIPLHEGAKRFYNEIGKRY